MSTSDQPNGQGAAPLVLRVAETAGLLAVSPRTVWRLIGTGDLSVVRVLGSVRVTRASVDAFLKRGGTRS